MLPHPSEFLQDTAHLITEPHLQTLVELIDHHIFNKGGGDVPLSKMIIESARGSEDDLRLDIPHLPMLIHRSTPTVKGHGAQSATHILQYRLRLQRQFPAGNDHHGLHLIEGTVDLLYQRQ